MIFGPVSHLGWT